MTPERCAGIAYLAPAAAVGGIWFILLTVATPSNVAVDFGFLQYALFEEPHMWMFWWLVLLPLACLALAAFYWSSVAHAKLPSLILCGIGAMLAAATWLTLDWSIALLVTFPLLFSLPRAKKAL